MDNTDDLIKKLGDEHFAVRKKALESINKTAFDKVIEPLIDALKDTDLQNRSVAQDALEKIGEAAVEPLLHALKTRDMDIRKNAAQILGKIGDTAAVESLIDTLRDLTLSLHVRAEAAEALGEFGDPRAVEPLLTLLTFDHPHVLKQAIIALEKIGSTRAVEPLMAALNSDYPSVRTYAARALGNIAADTDIVESFAGLTKHLDSTARKEAYNSITKICKKAPRDDFNFLCTKCFHRYVKHKVPFKKTVIYYACRSCRSSSYFLKGIEKIVLLVDHTFDKPYTRASETLAVNWYKIKKPFDFDEIRVNEKDDFDVEELAMKLKNDMDDERRKNLKHIPFYLSPGLKLSPAKMNLLKDNFQIHEYSGS
jgi:ribosomal protein L17